MSARSISPGRAAGRLGVILLSVVAAVLAVTVAPVGAAPVSSVRMVALGDSFSSGVGALTSWTTCGRSSEAWAPKAFSSPLLMAGSRYQRSGFSMLACAGATTATIARDQVPLVSSTDNVATLTAGGNDIGFSSLVMRCLGGSCPGNVFAVMATADASLDWWGLENRLAALYRSIRARMAMDGHLYVMTYPIPFAVSPVVCNGFTTAEQRAANALTTRLDDTIVRAVSLANRTMTAGRQGNVHVVEWRPQLSQRVANGYTVPSGYYGAGRTFDTYDDPTTGMCNSAGYRPNIQGISFALIGNSFHPSVPGYQRAALKLFQSLWYHQPPAR